MRKIEGLSWIQTMSKPKDKPGPCNWVIENWAESDKAGKPVVMHRAVPGGRRTHERFPAGSHRQPPRPCARIGRAGLRQPSRPVTADQSMETCPQRDGGH